MRTSVITLAVLATFASSTIATPEIGTDCASLAADARTGVFGCDLTVTAPNACVDDTTKDGEAWLQVLGECVATITEEKDVCGCYKQFLQEGYKAGCQTPENLQYVAAQGVRYGLGAPFFTGASNSTCTNTNIVNNIYSGPGTVFTASVGEGCLPACSQICSSEQCSSAVSSGPAAIMATVVAAAAYYLN